jgi:hypothetical protein
MISLKKKYQPFLRFSCSLEFQRLVTGIVSGLRPAPPSKPDGRYHNLTEIPSSHRVFLPYSVSCFWKPTNSGLPHLMCAAFRFFQPLSDLLLPEAHRFYFTPDPLLGFHPSVFFPFKDSDIFQYHSYRLSLYLNDHLLEKWSRLLPTEMGRGGGFHGFTPFESPFTGRGD